MIPNTPASGRHYGRVIAFVAVAIMLLASCDFSDVLTTAKDIKTETINALEQAIARLTNESASWQAVLKETEAKLVSDAQATIRNEIQSLINRSVATAGVEFRCDADFIGKRVRLALIRIKQELIGGQIDPVEPGFCQVDPLAVDRSLVPEHVNHVAFFGYDFDSKDVPIKVLLERADGSRTDVTSSLDRPTHYAMTLGFGGGHVQLDGASRRLILEWNGTTESTVAIIQPQTPVCQSKSVSFTPQNITFLPPHTHGDTDYSSNGPRTVADLFVYTDGSKVLARVFMDAKETTSDWTEATGTRVYDLAFPSEVGWKIDRVVSTPSSHFEYVDSNHDEDSFGPGGASSRMTFVGDTDGDDAGARTRVEIAFNQVTVAMTQNKDCVPPGVVHTLHLEHRISAAMFERLAPQAEAAMRARALIRVDE